jgi:hypothetical protein
MDGERIAVKIAAHAYGLTPPVIRVCNAARMPAHGGWEEGSSQMRPSEAADTASAPCSECGEPIRDDGRWYSTGTGELLPFCAVCARRQFGRDR